MTTTRRRPRLWLAGCCTAALAVALAAGCSRGRVTTVSFGQRIALPDHLTPGKTNVVDFYSDYCPPCRRLSPKLEALDRAAEDVVVLKVDINRRGVRGIDWQSPVARQFALDSIPYLRIYDSELQLVAEGTAAFERLDAVFRSAGVRW